MYLFLDAADTKGKISVALFIAEDKKIKIVNKISSQVLAEDILVLLDKILKTKRLSPQDLQGIAVTTGPGPYTSLRVAMSIGNSLAYGLNIPIVGVSKKEVLDQMLKRGWEKLKRARVGKYVTKINVQCQMSKLKTITQESKLKS